MRDYQEWHRQYDDPGSTLPWRLDRVRRHIAAFLDDHPGPVRVVSLCAGDARDLLGVLAGRDDADRVTATLVELDACLAEQARTTAAATAADVTVLTADAGLSDTYVDAVPADLVLLVGIFGNLSDADVAATVAASPQLCAPDATLIWTRGRSTDPADQLGDLDADVRRWFAEAGFAELDHATLERGSRPTVGVVSYDGPAAPLEPGRTWFTFLR